MVKKLKLKEYKPTRMEVAKTMVIVAMVVGGIAFYLGMSFQKSQQAEVKSAIKAAQTVAETPAKK